MGVASRRINEERGLGAALIRPHVTRGIQRFGPRTNTHMPTPAQCVLRAVCNTST